MLEAAVAIFEAAILSAPGLQRAIFDAAHLGDDILQFPAVGSGVHHQAAAQAAGDADRPLQAFEARQTGFTGQQR